jgi:hypothetical protein
VTLNRKPGRIQRMKRLEECTDSFGVLIDERLPADQAIGDEQRIPRAVLERRYFDRKRLSKGGQHRDLELERFLDAGASRKRNTHSSSTTAT